MIRFSVVIPVYKVEPYLDECVSSVVTQRFRDLEVILVDDGSPDNCGKMCDDWAKKDGRIRVVHQENGGLSAARNTGIRNAVGEYVLFLDSDDWWADADVLGTIDAQLQKTPVDVVSFNYRKFYEGEFLPTYFDENMPSSQKPEMVEYVIQNHIWISSSWNKAVRLSLVKERGLYFREGITSEDIDWSLRLAMEAHDFAYANVCALVYRQRASSISHNVTRKSVEMLCGNVERCIRLIEPVDTKKRTLLNSYVAYQYGTLIYNVALLPKSDRRCFTEKLKAYMYLLECSDDPKVKLIYRCKCVFGISITMMLLRLRNDMQKHSSKGV